MLEYSGSHQLRSVTAKSFFAEALPHDPRFVDYG